LMMVVWAAFFFLDMAADMWCRISYIVCKGLG
jgi:hypothetical protein